MRTALTLALLFLLTLVSTAPEAHARRRAKPTRDGPYSIAVAPFDGEGAGGRTISEAMELELELIETVLVKGDRWLRSDLRRAGKAGWEPSALRRIMKKRKVDILVRGRRAGDRLEVVVFGNDGQPRFAELFALPKNPDASARKIVEAMQPTLLRWPRGKVVELPSSSRGVLVRERQRKPEPAPAVSEEELFVDFEGDDGDDDVRGSQREPAEGGGAWDNDVRTDPDDAAVNEPDRPRSASERAAENRRRLLLDDEKEPDDRRPLLGGDSDRTRPEVTMADVEDSDGKRAPPFHWIAVSAGGVVNAWYYEFVAAKDAEDDLSRFFTTYGGGARVSFWPLEYVGLDVMAAVTTFHVQAEGLPVRPTELDVLGISAGASARARYPFKLGSFAFAPGVRAGYRYWGSTVEPQTNTEDDRAFTLIPGWQMHALSVGAELDASFVIDQWRFEAELHAEPLPLVRYEETPDNPAVYSRPLGGSATLLLRIPIYAPVYVEVSGSTTALFVTWEGGPGTRLSQTRTDGSNNRLRVDGGESLNAQFGGGLALGASF